MKYLIEIGLLGKKKRKKNGQSEWKAPKQNGKKIECQIRARKKTSKMSFFMVETKEGIQGKMCWKTNTEEPQAGSQLIWVNAQE